MTENYLVSVIIPVYGAEKYLESCIESVLGQTYTNLEIILVDDGSVDKSGIICDEYAENDHRITVIHQENKGVSAARNAGLDRVGGDYYAFVDSDDELYSNAIEFLLKDMLEYDADMASAVKTTVQPSGNEVNPYTNHKLNVYSGLDMLTLSLDGDRQTNSACAKLFSREKFASVRFEEGKSINEDGFYLFQCYTLKPRVVQHNESVYKYFIRSNSNSRNAFSEKYLDMLYFAERKKEITSTEFPELMDRVLTMEVSTHLFFLEILCRTSEKKYRKYAKKSIAFVKQNFKSFECINDHERKMAWIVSNGLYPLYKLAYKLRNVFKRKYNL